MINTQIIENLQILLHKEDTTLLEKLSFKENTFSEPLLIAYFNNKKLGTLSSEILTEIMQGFFIEKEPLKIKNSYNQNKIAYIPNIGYYNHNRELVEPILEIEDLEVIKELHPLLNRYLIEFYKGHITNPNPEYRSVWENHIATLKNALTLIKENIPDFFKEFHSANKKIFIHNNPRILNFTSIETLGMLYFYATPYATLMYFVEELIHQGSHNILYHITFDKKDFFKIDAPNTIMRDLTKQKWDYRDIYGAFHGVYTVYKRLECYDILLQKNALEGKDKHELLGRLADQFSRFHTGLELLNLDEVYTEKGKAFYVDLDKKCESIINKYVLLKREFDLSNRDLDFRYEDFCLLNSFEDFLIKDKQGFYNF
ncbi:hypothetical protein [Chryseobacterium sp.]|uniref:hypothetical protein n=1 Tax=Chryseobacterium sp. TaxID=1871047 RepID=UPI002FC87746